jgi:signal transduction histidine kinase
VWLRENPHPRSKFKVQSESSAGLENAIFKRPLRRLEWKFERDSDIVSRILVGLWELCADYKRRCPALWPWLAIWPLWGAPLSANATILMQRSQRTLVQNRSEEILHGALAPRDDSASDTLYFKFRVNPLSDIVSEVRFGRYYLAGMVFCEGGAENLGIGNAWSASGYSAFCKTFNAPGNSPGELNLHARNPEPGAPTIYLGPRREVPKTFVVKVEYVPGGEDQVTVWLDPDLRPGATEATQSERIVTRFRANASFDQIRLVHRGDADGWMFDDIAVATSFDDFVPKPFWRRPWFLTVAGAALVSAVLGGVVAAERRRARRQVALVEREQAVAAERVRIAHDLHDDLGARLTEIVLLGELAAKSAAEDHPSREVVQGLRQLHASLDEAVWSINPHNDTLANLVEFLSEYAQRFVRNAPAVFHLEAAEDLPQAHLSASQRHNLLLAVKEALNNAVRHARATKIWLRVTRTDVGVRVAVRDDGCGVESSQQRVGNGLINIRERLGAIGGKAEIRSQPGDGTEVMFELPLSS